MATFIADPDGCRIELVASSVQALLIAAFLYITALFEEIGAG